MGSNPIRATNLAYPNARSIDRLQAVFRFGACTTRLSSEALRYLHIHLPPSIGEGPQYVLRVQGLTYVDAKDGGCLPCRTCVCVCPLRLS